MGFMHTTLIMNGGLPCLHKGLETTQNQDMLPEANTPAPMEPSIRLQNLDNQELADLGQAQQSSG